MDNLLSAFSNSELSNSLKNYVAKQDSRYFFIDKSEAHVLPYLISKIGSSGDAFLVTTDPFDDYKIVAMPFGSVARLICNVISESQDIRVFGSSWAIGLSSYSSTAQSDSEVALSIDNLEIKITLIGSAVSWL